MHECTSFIRSQLRRTTNHVQLIVQKLRVHCATTGSQRLEGRCYLLAQIVAIQAAISPRSTEPPMTAFTGTQACTGLSASPMKTQRQHGSKPVPAFLTVGASSHHLTPTTLLLTCPTDLWRLEQAPLHRGILMRTKGPAADTSASTDSSADYSLQILQVGRVLHAVADRLACLLAQIVALQAAISPRSTEPPMTTYTGTQACTGLSASPMRTQRQHGSTAATQPQHS